MTTQEFIDKYQAVFDDNTYENITEATFREFSRDIAALQDPAQKVEATPAQVRDAASALALQEMVLYRIINRANGQPPVRVRAYSPSALASEEAYEEAAGGNLVPVTYNLATDTTAPRQTAGGIKPWAAGPYQASTLVSVIEGGELVLYYAKRNIGNSTQKPTLLLVDDWGRIALTPAEVEALIKKLVPVFTPFEETDWHPLLSTQRETDEFLLSQVKALRITQSSNVVIGKPTEGQVDDLNNTFSGLAVAGFPAFAQYEGFWPGSGGNVVLSDATAYQVGTRIYLKNIATDAPAGSVGFRVAASGSQPAGPFLLNATAFTAAAGAPAAPTISLSGPDTDADGDFTLTASVSGPVPQRVELLGNGGVVLESRTPEQGYAFSITDAAEGARTYTAKVYPLVGNPVTSQPFTVQVAAPVVVAPVNAAPLINFNAPANGATVTQNVQLLLTITATDDVSVVSVEFLNGNTGASLGMGSKNGSTYTLPYTPSVTGSLSLVAKALDGAGLATTATVIITVQSATAGNTTPDAPTVSFDSATRILTASHPLGTGELVYSVSGGAYQAYAALSIDDNSHVAGKWKFKVKAATGRNESGTADSPAIAVKVVAPTNAAPTANAGANVSITLPTNSAPLSGSGTDSDGTISAYLWTQVSGPNTATIANTGAASTTASNLVAGVYTFRLTTTDNDGATATDDVQITVNAAAETQLPVYALVVGDSLEYGNSDPTNSVYNQLRTQYGEVEFKWVQAAVNGQPVSNALANPSVLGSLDAQLAAKDFTKYRKHIVIVGGGVNDMRLLYAGYPGADVVGLTYSAIRSVHQKASAAGWESIALTHTHYSSANYTSTQNATFAADLIELDKRIRAYWVSDFGAEALIDLGANTQIGTGAYNAALFTDGVHFTTAGTTVKKNLIVPGFDAVVAGNSYGVVTPLVATNELYINDVGPGWTYGNGWVISDAATGTPAAFVYTNGQAHTPPSGSFGGSGNGDGGFWAEYVLPRNCAQIAFWWPTQTNPISCDVTVNGGAVSTIASVVGPNNTTPSIQQGVITGTFLAGQVVRIVKTPNRADAKVVVDQLVLSDTAAGASSQSIEENDAGWAFTNGTGTWTVQDNNALHSGNRAIYVPKGFNGSASRTLPACQSIDFWLAQPGNATYYAYAVYIDNVFKGVIKDAPTGGGSLPSNKRGSIVGPFAAGAVLRVQTPTSAQETNVANLHTHLDKIVLNF